MNWIKNHKVIVAIISVLLIVGLVLAITLPLTIGKNPANRVVYDRVKTTKMNNFKLLNEAEYTKHGQVVLIGDSITEIYNTELYNTYTERTHLTVYNRGISGDFSLKLLERIEINALNIKPSYMCMLIGTNDIAVGVPNEEIISNIAAIIDKTRESSPATKIVIQAIYPVNHSVANSAAGTRTNKTINEVNDGIRQMIINKALPNVTYVNFNEWLSDANGELRAEYTYDGLHPNAACYVQLTARLISYFGYSKS